MPELTPWSTRAINLPEHADNPMHTDEGAHAAGFAGALVAGTSVYAYMTRPPAVAWGDRWLAGGGGEVWFRRPVLDGERVDCLIDPEADGTASVVATVDGEARCTFSVWPEQPAPAARHGERFDDIELEMTHEWAEYGTRSGDDLAWYAERAIAHPAVWPALANHVFKRFLVDGPWIHTRSRIHHQALVAVGAEMRIESTLVERRDSRAGERAIVDIVISTDGKPACTIEHEAIVRLA